jgi:hypothetical protein
VPRARTNAPCIDFPQAEHDVEARLADVEALDGSTPDLEWLEEPECAEENEVTLARSSDTTGWLLGWPELPGLVGRDEARAADDPGADPEVLL